MGKEKTHVNVVGKLNLIAFPPLSSTHATHP